jgi:DNA-binding CsgD family transcriptional regulator
VVAMRKMSPKQHAALQMVLRGATNADIAERFGVTESTAKVYVRSIMGHVGARTRAQIVAKMLNAFNDMGESDYQIIAGIPKDWDANWHKYPEVNKTLFEKTRG